MVGVDESRGVKYGLANHRGCSPYTVKSRTTTLAAPRRSKSVSWGRERTLKGATMTTKINNARTYGPVAINAAAAPTPSTEGASMSSDRQNKPGGLLHIDLTRAQAHISRAMMLVEDKEELRELAEIEQLIDKAIVRFFGDSPRPTVGN